MWVTTCIMLGNDCDLRLKNILKPFLLELVRCAFIGLRFYFVILFPLHLLLPMVTSTIWRNATCHIQYNAAKLSDADISVSWLLWIISTLLWLASGSLVVAVVAGPCAIIYKMYDSIERKMNERDFWAVTSRKLQLYCTNTVKPVLLGRDAGCMKEINLERLPQGVRNQLATMRSTILFETC